MKTNGPRLCVATLWGALVACGGEPAARTCGEGTREQGSTCVAAPPALPASAPADAAGPAPDAGSGDAGPGDAGPERRDAGPPPRGGDPCPGRGDDVCHGEQIWRCLRVPGPKQLTLTLEPSEAPCDVVAGGRCVVEQGNAACVGGVWGAPCTEGRARCYDATTSLTCHAVIGIDGGRLPEGQTRANVCRTTCDPETGHCRR